MQGFQVGGAPMKEFSMGAEIYIFQSESVRQSNEKICLENVIFQERIFETRSHNTMPALTEILNECLVPNCGISMAPWQRSTTDC